VYRCVFELGSFDTLSIEDRKGVLTAGTEWLAFVNLRFLRSHPSTPRLYQIAPKYDLKVRNLGFDRWADVVKVYSDKSGDCKDFVAIRMAEELLLGNFQCRPFVTHKEIRDPRNGELYQSFHVQLACGGQIDDPAAKLGMPRNVSIDQIRRLFR
jgi:hypothetical protein